MRGDVIRVKGLYGTGVWEQLGVDRYPGREPQGVQYSFNHWGSDALTFTIQRDPGLSHPDLEEFTPVEVMRGERIVWSGFIIETPAAQDRTMSVTCRGWQYHLDDDVFTDYYVHADLSEWKDMRDIPTAKLGNSSLASSGQVQVGDGQMVLSFPEGAVVVNGATVGAVLDLGPGNVARYARFRIGAIPDGVGTPAGSTVQVVVRGTQAPNNQTTSGGGWQSGTFTDVYNANPIDTGTMDSYKTGSISAKRYVQAYVRIASLSSSPHTLVSNITIPIDFFKVYEQSIYHDVTPDHFSQLRATNVISDALTRAPLLNQSTSKVATTFFSIPHYSFIHEERTPRQVMEDMNNYHRFLLRVLPDRTLEFRAPTNSPRLQLDTNDFGVQFQDASVSSGTDMYNRVIGRGTQGDGERIKYTTATANNAITKRGFFRTKVFDVQFPIDPAALQQICDTYLSLNSRSVLKGSVSISTDTAVTATESQLVVTGPATISTGKGPGAPIPMSELGFYVGEPILIRNLVDPDTGAMGRVGTIAGVQMNADSVTLTLDNQRSHFEGLLSRMGVVTARA